MTMGEYHTDCDFRDREGENQKIRQFYETRRDEALSEVKNLPAYLAFGVAAAAAVGAFFLGYFLFAVTVIAAAYGGFRLFSNSKRRAQLAPTVRTALPGSRS